MDHGPGRIVLSSVLGCPGAEQWATASSSVRKLCGRQVRSSGSPRDAEPTGWPFEKDGIPVASWPAGTWLLCLAGGLLLAAARMIRAIAIGVGVVMSAIVWLARTDLSAGARPAWPGWFFCAARWFVLAWEMSVYARTGKVFPLGNGPGSTIYHWAHCPPRRDVW
jgi:hypothetical protein